VVLWLGIHFVTATYGAHFHAAIFGCVTGDQLVQRGLHRRLVFP
jgi:hypothetical protein